MSSIISVNPLLLSFSERSLETKYREWRTRCTFVAMDRTFSYANLIIHVIFTITEAFDGGPYVGMVLLCLSIVTYLLQLLLIDFQDGQFWLKHRTPFVLVLRTFRVFLSAVGIPLWVRGPSHNWPTFVRALILRSGALLNVWMALGMPIIFSRHLLVHIPLSLLMLVATGWPSCQELMESTAAIEKLTLLNDNVDVVLQWIVRPDLLLNKEREQLMSGDGYCDCCRLLILLYMTLSMAFPSFVLWLLEKHSRISFIQVIRQSRDSYLRRIFVDMTPIPDAPKMAILLITTILALTVMI